MSLMGTVGDKTARCRCVLTGRRLCGQGSPLLQERVTAVAVDNKVILTQTSCGYLEFAVNWITHVEALGITNWLTIAEDETALKFLEERYPGHALPASAFTNQALSDGNALYEWGSAAFTKVACARPTYLQVRPPSPAIRPSSSCHSCSTNITADASSP